MTGSQSNTWTTETDPKNPAQIKTMTAQEGELSLHIERLTESIFVIVSPDGPNHHVSVPQTPGSASPLDSHTPGGRPQHPPGSASTASAIPKEET